MIFLDAVLGQTPVIAWARAGFIGGREEMLQVIRILVSERRIFQLLIVSCYLSSYTYI